MAGASQKTSVSQIGAGHEGTSWLRGGSRHRRHACLLLRHVRRVILGDILLRRLGHYHSRSLPRNRRQKVASHNVALKSWQGSGDILPGKKSLQTSAAHAKHIAQTPATATAHNERGNGTTIVRCA